MRHDSSPGPGIPSFYISCLIFVFVPCFISCLERWRDRAQLHDCLLSCTHLDLAISGLRGSALTSERAVLFRIRADLSRIRADLSRIRAVRFGVDLISELVLFVLICRVKCSLLGCWKGSRVRLVFTLTAPISSSVLELAIRRLVFCVSSIRDLQKFWTCILSNISRASSQVNLILYSCLVPGLALFVSWP